MSKEFEDIRTDKDGDIDLMAVAHEDLIFISAADLAHIIKQQPELNKPPIENILEEIGMDTSKGYDTQRNVQHRDMFNNIVTTDRFVGYRKRREK